MTATPNQRVNPEDVDRTLAAFIRPGQVTEVRAFGMRWGTVSGYFNDPMKCAAAICQLSGGCPGVYFVPNEINPDLLTRAVNRMNRRPKATTADKDIIRRRQLSLIHNYSRWPSSTI